jgi:hypothetical protein
LTSVAPSAHIRFMADVEVEAKATAKPLKRCKCGHDRHHQMVTATGDYTFGGWCLVLFGISAKPRAIKFQCRRCDEVFDRASDKKTIEETRLWG